MAVLRTTSPEARPAAPADVPRKTVPSANARRAGGGTGTAAGSLGGQMCRAGPARAGPALQRTSKVYRDSCDLIKLSAVDRLPARRKQHRFLNRAKIDESLFTTRKNENVTTSRTSIGALPLAEFLPQRVSLLYRLSGNDVPAILLTSVIAAFALWGYISDKLLVAWLIWLVVASLVRIVLKRAYRLRRPEPEAAGRWEGYFCLA